MAIAPVPAISLESVRALSLGDAMRDGQVVEAKVTAMLTETLARLSIDGKAIDVSTPKPLPVGAMMTLKAERDGGQLRLITQGPIRTSPEAGVAGSAADLPDTLIDPLKTVLAKIQAMAVEGRLDQRAPSATAAAPSSAAAFADLADEASSSQRATGQAATPPTAAVVPQGEAGEAATSAQPSRPPQAAQSPLPLPPLPNRGAPGPEATAPRATSQPTQTRLPPTTLAVLGDELLSSPRTGVEAPPSPSLPAGLRELALDAALRLRSGAEAEPESAPAAKALATALGALQAMLVEGETADDLATQDDGVTTKAPPEMRLHAPAAGHHTASDADLPDTAALASKIAAAAHDALHDARPTAGAAPLPDVAQPLTAASDPAAAQMRAERAAVHFSFDVPLYFPGNPQPLRLEVTRDDGDGEENEGNDKPRSWTIRFAAEAGPLGMIHAAISQTGEQIGVQLWAERGETAALFKQSARDLQDSLEASNLKLDALRIAEGRPEEKAPARSAAGPDIGREEIL